MIKKIKIDLIMEKIKAYLIALRNITIGINLISFRLLLNPKRLVGTISTLLFHYSTLSDSRRLEQKSPDKIFPNKMKYEIKIDTNSKNFWGFDSSYTKDIVTLCIFAKLIQAKRIFEIGTLNGYTALHFAMNTSPNSKIFTLDLSKNGNKDTLLKSTVIDKKIQTKHSNIKNYCFNNTGYENKINCLFGDSAIFDFTDFHANIDLFFIDGSHSYEYVKSDTLNAVKCVKKGGGIIVWHDYGRWGVNGISKWLHEFSSQGNKIYSVPGSSLAWMIR